MLDPPSVVLIQLLNNLRVTVIAGDDFDHYERRIGGCLGNRRFTRKDSNIRDAKLSLGQLEAQLGSCVQGMGFPQVIEKLNQSPLSCAVLISAYIPLPDLAVNELAVRPIEARSQIFLNRNLRLGCHSRSRVARVGGIVTMKAKSRTVRLWVDWPLRIGLLYSPPSSK